jgi:hypothetical protein
MDLQGTLDIFPLSELIDMAGFSSLTGVISIFADGPNGRIFFSNGKPYHAECGASEGPEALALLFELTQARFRIENDQICDRDTLWGDVDYHLRHARQLAQRWSRVRPILPGLDLVPQLTATPNLLAQRISPAHQAIFELIDGEASVARIIADSGWGDIDAAEVVAQFVRDGVAVMMSAPQALPRRKQQARVSPSGLLDRLAAASAVPTEPAAADVAVLPPPRSATENWVLQILRN